MKSQSSGWLLLAETVALSPTPSRTRVATERPGAQTPPLLPSGPFPRPSIGGASSMPHTRLCPVQAGASLSCHGGTALVLSLTSEPDRSAGWGSGASAELPPQTGCSREPRVGPCAAWGGLRGWGEMGCRVAGTGPPGPTWPARSSQRCLRGKGSPFSTSFLAFPVWAPGCRREQDRRQSLPSRSLKSSGEDRCETGGGILRCPQACP